LWGVAVVFKSLHILLLHVLMYVYLVLNGVLLVRVASVPS
jgi:hypothetical protein